MTSRIDRSTVLGAAAFVGLSTDLLFNGSDGPGLNMSLFFGAVAAAVLIVTRGVGRRPDREALMWIVTGVLLGTAFLFRASPALLVPAFITAALCFAIAAYRGGIGWARRGSVADFLSTVPASALHALFGPIRFAVEVFTDSPDPDDAADDREGIQYAAIARGLLIAAPLLLVFGALFASADRFFADAVGSVAGRAAEEWAGHLVVVLFFGWLALGYLLGFLEGTRIRERLPLATIRPSLGAVEVGVALGAVNLLFAAFVMVQFRYLFGGASLVEVTPGLTYADYAREGFGQLAFAAVLVLPLLLAADWLFRPRDGRDRWLVPGLGWTLLALLGVVVASAVQRVRVYQDAYGLTESRFYGLVFLGWIAATAAWLGWTVLRGHRERFAPLALVSAVGVILGLQIIGPTAWIARSNLAQSGTEIDGVYLVSLGPDAVPTLVDALPSTPPEARCQIATRLLDRWSDRNPLDWRSWSWSVERARRAVAMSTAPLQAAAATGCAEGEAAAMVRAGDQR